MTMKRAGHSGRDLNVAAQPDSTVAGPHSPPTTVFTNVSWAVDADGDWSVPSDWSAGKKPTSSNNVTLATAHAHTVTHSTGSDTANSVTATTDLLSITGGTLNLNAASSFGAGLSISGGTLLLKAGASTGSGLVLDGGTLSVAKATSLAVGGAVTFGDTGGGVGYLTGGGTLATTGATTIGLESATTALYLGGNTAWSNGGTVSVGAYITFGVSGSTTGGTIVNQASGTFALLDSGNINTVASVASVFTNAGTLTRGGGTSVSTFIATLNTTGLVSVTAGTLSLQAGGSLAGTLSGAGTTLLDVGNFTINSALAGTGNLALAATGTLSSTGTASFGGTVASDGTLAAATGDTLTLSGAVTLGTGPVSALATLSGPGTIVTTGATSLPLTGGVIADLAMGGGVTWINSGTGTATIGGYINNGLSGDTLNDSIINQAGATLDFAGDYSIIQNTANATLTITNAGTLAKISGTATTTEAAILNSTGVLQASSGILAFELGGSLAGAIAAGGGVVLFGAGNFTIGSAVTGTGTLGLGMGGELTATSNASFTGTVISSGTLAATAGHTLTLSGPVTLGTGPTNGYATLARPGTIVTTGITSLPLTGGVIEDLTIGNGITWSNAAGGTATVGGYINVGLAIASNDTIINQAGATLNFAGDYSIIQNVASDTLTITNAGTLAKISGTATTTEAAILNSTGVLMASSGTLAFELGGSVAGTVGAGAGVVLLDSGNFTIGSALLGSGTLGLGSTATLTTTSAASFTGALQSIGTIQLAAAAPLTLSGSVHFGNGGSGATVNGPGTLTTTGATTLALVTNTVLDLQISNGATWINSGSATVGGYINFGDSGTDANVAIVNTATGTFAFTGDEGQTQVNGAVGASFANAGTLTKTGGTGASTLVATLASTGLVTASSGTLNLTGGGTLAGSIGATATGTVLLGANFATGGALSILDDGTKTSLLVGASETFTNAFTITDLGRIILSASTTLSNAAGGIITLAGDDAQLLAASGATAYITNAGTVTKSGGTGVSQIGGSLTNNGLLDAASGTLKLVGAAAGTGNIHIDAGGALELGVTSNPGQTLTFTGGGGAELVLDKPASIGAALIGFGGGDRIDIVGKPVTSASISGGTLSVVTSGATYKYISSQSLAPFATSITSDGNGGSIVSLYRSAIASAHTPEPVAFGNHHVGDIVSLSIGLTNTALADGYSEKLDATLAGVSGGFSEAGSVAGLAAGAGPSNAISVTLNTGTAGAYSDTGTLNLSSDGTGQDLRGVTSLGTQAVNITGAVYAYAMAQLASVNVNLGVVHVGSSASGALSLTNIAALGGFSEALDATWLSSTGGITATGLVSMLGAGGTDMSSLLLAIATGLSGTMTGSAQLLLTSDGTTIDGLGTTVLGTQAINVTGIVDNYAVAQFEDTNGGLISGSGTQYTLSLGSVMQGSGALVADLGVLNAVGGLADLLGGTITTSGGAGFNNSSFGSFSGLGAGQDEHLQVVSLDTSTAGAFSETIVLTSAGSNASGYNGALATETLTITGTVQQATVYYQLTTGIDVITGANGQDVFQAFNGTLNSRDQLTGGTGANTLTLNGYGVFDIGALKTFANIQTVVATEGQAQSGANVDTSQVVYLRDGTAETVNVLAGVVNANNPNPEGITIYGGANTDTINLATGSDTVVLAAGTESIDGGGGNALIQGLAAYGGAKIVGGTTGTTTFEITNAGTTTLNAADTNLTVQLDAAGKITLSAMSFVTAIGSAGKDTLIAGATGQTLTGGLGMDSLTGFTGFGDTFLDSSAGLNGDTIVNFGGSDVIDLTDMANGSLKPLAFASGTLTVKDGAHTAAIKFTGSYALTNFSVLGSDGHGGTLIGWHS